MKAALLTTAIGLFATAGAAGVSPVFYASSGSTLYRADGAVSTFALSENVVGMTTRSDGSIIATTTTNTPGFYSVTDPGGTPSLSALGSDGNIYTSLTYVGGQLYGFFDGGQNIYEINDATYTGTAVDAVGVNFTNFGGSAYDADTQTFYALGNNNQSGDTFLYSISGIGTNALSANLIGDIGVNGAGISLEFYDGTLYAAVQNIESGNFEIGSLNTTTGAYALEQTLATSFSSTTVALAIVPAPSGLCVIALGGFAAARRRR